MNKKGDISIDTIIIWAIVILMLLILLVIILKNTGALNALWDKIMGAF